MPMPMPGLARRLLAALQVDAFEPAKGFAWFRSIPRLAALMAFELHGVPPQVGTAVGKGAPRRVVVVRACVRACARMLRST